MIIMVMGLPGSGKSYFAIQLAQRMNADYISSDQIRNEIVSKKTYSENEKLAVYNEMLVRMLNAVKGDRNVILDATFYKAKFRKQFAGEGKSNEVLYIEIVADDQTVMGRLSRPRTNSDADFEVYKKIKREWEPLTQPHLILRSTNNNIEEMLNKATNYLHVSNDNRTNT
jgi:predicted kinase